MSLANRYEKYLPVLDRFKCNLEEALRLFLQENSIQFLSAYGRVKTLQSLREKVERKSYASPLIDAEDIVGCRVIVYYHDDIDKVNEFLNREFVVHEQTDKTSLLKENEVGYRSSHSIISVKKQWCATPNYRGLEEVRAEIQVRTVLMHAWAEVEHKLQYKNTQQVPSHLRRKLYLLSAQFETADLQLQSLREEIEKYQQAISEQIKQTGAFDTSLEMNLGTVRQFLEFHYPDLAQFNVHERQLCDEIIAAGRSFVNLTDIAEKFTNYQSIIRKEITTDTRANTFRYACQVFDPTAFPSHNLSPGRKKLINRIAKAAGLRE